MNRREFTTRALGAALTGIVAAKTLLADNKANAASFQDKNSCKGKGGCAVPVKKAA